MSEVELGRLKIIKRRAWNKERCVCQWLTLCGRARARADERRNGRPDVVSRNVQTSETEHFRTNVSYRPSAHRATGIIVRPHLTQGPVPQRARGTHCRWKIARL